MLQQALEASESGQRLARASSIRRAMQLGFSLSLDEISCEVFRVLDLMDSEEKRLERQKAEEQERKWRATK